MNPSTTATGTTSPATAPWPGDDFPTWLSPMLVKELRQGVQSGVFAWTFILLQAAMFVLLTLWVLTQSEQSASTIQDNQLFHGFFWSLFGLAAVVVLPFRASASMAAERIGNTLDLLRITHLSSTQIVVGKWLAIMAQVLLISTAVLPYLVLQYFFGGLDLVADLFAFVFVLLAASVMTAASVAAGGQPAWTRGLFGLVAFITITNIAAGGSVSGVSALSLWSSLPALAVVAGLGTAVFLVYSAATIAPPAENHALRARVLALVATGLALAAPQLFDTVPASFVVAVAVPLVAGIVIAELTSDPVAVTAIHRPFTRFGVAGRLAAFLFTPGWATAVCFIPLTATLLAIACMQEGSSRASVTSSGRLPVPDLFALGVATILFPLPVMLCFPPGKPRKTAFVLVQVVSVVVFCFRQTPFGQSDSSAAAAFYQVAHLFPLTSLFEAFSTPYGRADAPTVAVPLIMTGLGLASLVPRFLRALAATSAQLTAAGQAGRLSRGSRSPAA